MWDKQLGIELLAKYLNIWKELVMPKNRTSITARQVEAWIRVDGSFESNDNTEAFNESHRFGIHQLTPSIKADVMKGCHLLYNKGVIDRKVLKKLEAYYSSRSRSGGILTEEVELKIGGLGSKECDDILWIALVLIVINYALAHSKRIKTGKVIDADQEMNVRERLRLLVRLGDTRSIHLFLLLMKSLLWTPFDLSNIKKDVNSGRILRRYRKLLIRKIK